MTARPPTGWLALLLACGIATRAAAQVTLRPPVKAPLAVSVSAPEGAAVGEAVPLRIQVGNTGDAPFTNGVLHVELSAGLKHAQGGVIEAELPALAPGETRTVTLALTAAEPGLQTAAVLVTAGGTEATARATVAVLKPVLELRLDGPEHRFLGRTAEFDLDVANNGNEAFRNVVVIAALPAGLEFAEASDRGAHDEKGRQVRWALGSLAPRQHRGLTLRLRPQGVGGQTVRATAKADGLPEANAEATVRGDAVPCLQMEVRDLDDPVPVGGETAYEIRVFNRGSCPAVRVQVIGQVPDGLTLLDATGPTQPQIEGPHVVFPALPRLAPGAEVLYRVQVRGGKAGDWRFRVQMYTDQLRLPLAEEEATRVYEP